MESADSSRTVALGYYAAIAAHDMDGLLALIDEDVVLREAASLPYGGTHHGRDKFVEVLSGATEFVDINSIVLEHLVVDGERAAANVAYRAPSQQDGPPSYCLDWLVIRGGKIVELTPFYFDTAAMLAGRTRSTAEQVKR
jgi:uncharacterized protein